MMDKKYILENGLLELYVLDELGVSDRYAVEQSILEYPELKDELSQIEHLLEKFAIENAITPPESILQSIQQKISSTNQKESINISKRSYLSIAATILVLLGIASTYILYQKNNTIKKDLYVIEESNKSLIDTLKNVTQELNVSKEQYAFLNDANTDKYILRGNSKSPNTVLISYVNSKTKKVVLDTKDLEELDTNHDYQLWADVDGEMISMGLIKPSSELITKDYLANSESLNITIEPLGGSDHPTVSNLITNVALK